MCNTVNALYQLKNRERERGKREDEESYLNLCFVRCLQQLKRKTED